MKRSASTLLSGASSAKAARIDKAHLDRSKTILDDAIAVFQRLNDLGSATFNVLELSAAGQIGIQIVEIINVRPKTLFFDEQIDESIMRADLESASKSGGIRGTRETHSTDTRHHSEDFRGRK